MEYFLGEGEVPSETNTEVDPNLTTEEILRKPIYIPSRAKKDPRDLRILDPACGSGHFLLYVFDLLVIIYKESWEDEAAPISKVSGKRLRDEYLTLEDLLRALPCLIIRNNLFGVDIDPRASQIAALSLWMRAHRSFRDFGIGRSERQFMTKINIVAAEPMPGEMEIRREFIKSLDGKMGQIVEHVFKKMELAGQAGSLLLIENEIKTAIREIYGTSGELFSDVDEERWQKAEIELECVLKDYISKYNT